MSKNQSESKETKKEEKTTTATTTAPTSKLAVFEEDDYFEEFEDEGFDDQTKEDIDFKQWQEDWEDEENNDHFEDVLRKEFNANRNVDLGANVEMR